MNSIRKQKPSSTSEVSASPVLSLAAPFLEDGTLIFPWGRSSPNSPRTVNYLQYVFSLPSIQRTRAILRLLGMAKYRPRRLLTLALGKRQRSLNDFLGPYGAVPDGRHHYRRALDNRRGYHNQDYQEYQEEMWPL